MTLAVQHNNYAVAVGTASDNVSIPVYSNRAPTTADKNYPIGKRWINMVANTEYVLTSNAAGNPPLATWITTGGGTTVLSTLTGDTGTAVPVAGNIKIAGTSGQITTTASGGAITLSLPNPLVVPGELDVNSGNLVVVLGNLNLQNTGAKINISTGTNASIGTSAAMGGTPGTVTVTTTAANTTSQILYSRATPGGTLGNVSITKNSGNFVLLSTGNETSTFDWLIIN